MKELKLLILPSIEQLDEIVDGISFPMKVTKGRYSELEFRFKNGKTQLFHKGVDIKRFSYVWLSSFWRSRDLAYCVQLYLDYNKIPHSFVEHSSSKITDQLAFNLNNIKTPNTYYIAKRNAPKHIDDIEKTCGYPIIIKDLKGKRGKFSLLSNNRAELLENISKLRKNRRYLFQEFIPNDYDWGILVANGNVVSAEKSYHKEGEFRNNACNGSKEVFVRIKEIPKKVKDMALKASNSLELSWSRADIVIDKVTHIPYLLEVNRSPGITTCTTEVTGAQEFLKSIYETF